MVSQMLKVTPALTENYDYVSSYFPEASGLWVNLNQLNQTLKGGSTYQLDIRGPSVNVHLMPGCILAFQNNSIGSIT